MRLRIITTEGVSSLASAACERLVSEFARSGHDAALLPSSDIETLAEGDVAVTWNGLGARTVPPGVALVCLLHAHPMHFRGLFWGRTAEVLLVPAARSWAGFLERHAPASVAVLHAPAAPVPIPTGNARRSTEGGVAVWGDVEDPDGIWRLLDTLPSRVRNILEAFRDAAVVAPREALHDVYRQVLGRHGVDVPHGRWKEADHATFGRYAEVVERWTSAVRFNGLVKGLDEAGVKLSLIGRGFETLGLRGGHRRVDPSEEAEAFDAALAAGVAAVRTSSPEFLDVTALGLLASGVPLLTPHSQSLRRLFDTRGGLVFLDDDSSSGPGEAVLSLLRDPAALARRSVLAQATVDRHFSWSATARAIVQHLTSARAGRGTR